MPARLAGRVAVITGAGSGIGRSAAQLFAAEGASVVVAELVPELGEETVRLVQRAGGDAALVQTDVSDEASVATMVGKTLARYGKLDILYNNAGGSSGRDGKVTEVALEEFWRAIRLDLFGTWLCSRACIPELIKAGGGAIVNMVSNVALRGFKRLSAYTAAKGAVVSLTRAMAVDYAEHGIRVNAIAPSVTLTERLKQRMQTSDTVQRMAERHLLGPGEPIDVAQGALYLASAESGRITGHILRIDSGMTIT